MIEEELYRNYLKSGQIKEVHSLNTTNSYYSYIYKRFIKNQSLDNSIVDLGCGYGEFVQYLKLHGFKNTTGVEISLDLVNLARKIGVEDIFHDDLKSYLNKLKERSVHIFFAKDILEHFELAEVVSLLKLMHKILEVDGKIIGHVPNAEGIFGMRVRYGDLTHKSAFTQKSLEQLISNCGFKSIKIYEDVPHGNSIKSIIRNVLWKILTAPVRFLFYIETGNKRIVLSQNLTFVVEK